MHADLMPKTMSVSETSAEVNIFVPLSQSLCEFHVTKTLCVENSVNKFYYHETHFHLSLNQSHETFVISLFIDTT